MYMSGLAVFIAQVQLEVPKPMLQKLDEWLDRLMKDMSDAKNMSLKLKGLPACTELENSLCKCAADMESLYTKLAAIKRAGSDPSQADVDFECASPNKPRALLLSVSDPLGPDHL